jgi:hypothetical protein
MFYLSISVYINVLRFFLMVAVSLYDSLGVIVDSVWVNVTVFATNVTCLGGQCSDGSGGGKPANGGYSYKVTSCSACNSMYVARAHTHTHTHTHKAHTERLAVQFRHRVLRG